MKITRPKTIVFITGAFVSNDCWKEWQAYFEQKGYTTIAPPWPHKDAPAEVLRNRHPDSEIASNRLADLTNYYAQIVEQLPEKPILIGHSIGGLMVQLLLQRGLGAAGIAIHSVPPQGIFTFKLSFLKAGWGPLGFFTSTKETYMMSFKDWQYAFTNGMPLQQQKDGYYQFALPESKLIVRDTITAAAHVDFSKPHAPLLLTSGSTDHTIPASLNYDNYRKYQHSDSITDYKEFEGRNHFVLGQPTWKEDADYILNWINNTLPQPEITSKILKINN
ncbi:alpha/beta hydrolase [Spirosoma litoris]